MLKSTLPDVPTRSDFFVGRETEIEKFTNEFLSDDSSYRILSIDTDGKGGIGKTRMLLHMQKSCRRNIYSANELIDFYQHESRDRIRVMEQISTALGDDAFPNFSRQLREFDAVQDIAKRQELINELQETFFDDYHAFSLAKAKKGMVIVIFFDSYEYIQREIISATGRKLCASDFSVWLEKILFAKLVKHKNIRLVIAGRFQPIDVENKITLRYRLEHFQLEDTELFLQERLQEIFRYRDKFRKGQKAVDDINVSGDNIKKIHVLADGRPIFLALFVDWIKYSETAPKKLITGLLSHIEDKSKGKIKIPVSNEQRGIFEEKLIENVNQLLYDYTQMDNSKVAPVYALTLLAIAYHRVTPDILSVLLAGGASMEDCEAVVETLKPWSFIKQKKENTILLHDEMRRLLRDHYWRKDQEAYKEYLELLIGYYEEQLIPDASSKAVRNVYFSELLEYAFDTNFSEGLDRFCLEFDLAMDDGEYNYAEPLLRQAEGRASQEPVENIDVLKIELRRIRYDTDTDENYKNAATRADDILKKYEGNSRWDESDIKGQFLVFKGAAKFWLGDYAEAIVSFTRAKQIFFDIGYDYGTCLVLNWIGYTYYQQARFPEAEELSSRSQKGFHALLLRLSQKPDDKQRKLERRQILQGIHMALGNQAMIYFYTKRFYKAVISATIQFHIVTSLPRNSKEISRSLNVFSLAMHATGHRIEAREHIQEADGLLAQINERLLSGRVKLNRFWQEFHEKVLLYPFEYYRAEEFPGRLRELQLTDEDRRKLKALLEGTIKTFQTPFPIARELSGAYLALSELHLINSSFEEAEQALENCLKWAGKSKFKYHEIDGLKNLVRLAYFSGGKLDAEKFKSYKAELDLFVRSDTKDYAESIARYELILGNIAFDKALNAMYTQDDESSSVSKVLEQGLNHYVSAAKIVKDFNRVRYHMIRVLFHKRLRTFINPAENKPGLPSKTIEDYLDGIKIDWKGDKSFKKLFEYSKLSIGPQEKQDDIMALAEELFEIRYELDNDWLAVRCDSLINAIKRLSQEEATNIAHSIFLAIWLVRGASFNLRIGYRDKASRFLAEAKAELNKLEQTIERDENQFSRQKLQAEAASIQGRINSTEATWKYYQVEYREFVEFYLREEFTTARKKAERHSGNVSSESLALLQEGEELLEQAIREWKGLKSKARNDKEKQYIERRIRDDTHMLSAVRLWTAEVMMLNGNFGENENKTSGALEYMERAMEAAEKCDSVFRLIDAMESYITVRYFKDDNRSGECHPKCLQYEDRLEKMTEEKEKYPVLFGKLRLTQGDRLFSRYFDCKQADRETGEYEFTPHDTKMNIPMLRRMLRHYVEACNFMAQVDEAQFFTVLRVLLMRIRMIRDKDILEILGQGLHVIWRDQPHLRYREKDLWMLIGFIQIMQDIISYEKKY